MRLQRSTTCCSEALGVCFGDPLLCCRRPSQLCFPGGRRSRQYGHDKFRLWIRSRMLHRLQHDVPQHRTGWPGPWRGADRVCNGRPMTNHRLRKQIALRLEMSEKRSARDPGGCSDVIDRRLFESLVHEQPQGGFTSRFPDELSLAEAQRRGRSSDHEVRL